ncbi:MAG: FtsX-like permease family protein [Pseudohongiellaceae bacterium]
MFINSVNLSLRTLARNRLYVLINVAGLALAMACCLFMGFYLYGELTYDHHHVNRDQIFRIADAYEDYDTGNQRRELALTSPMLGPMLARDFPEIQAFVRFRPLQGDVLIRHEGQGFYWQNTYYADDNVFNVFTHNIVFGDPETALVDPQSMAISATVARTYFGDANPVGQLLSLEDGDIRRVSLVFDDLPGNSHLKYDALFSHNHPSLTIAEADVPRFLYGVNTYTYLLMRPGYAAAEFDDVQQTFYQRYMEELSSTRTNRAWDAWLQPLTSIHLGPALLDDQPTGNRLNLYVLTSVMVFILLIACSNYTNLATAGYFKRRKEVAIRKILGEGASALVSQFLLESLALALVSACLGVFIVELLTSSGAWGMALTNVQHLNLTWNPVVLLSVIGFCVVIGALSGFYPALYLSSVSPLSGLFENRDRKVGSINLRLRELLILLQFTISVGVLASTTLVALQVKYLTARPLGFQAENRILVTLRGQTLIDQIPVIENLLAGHAGVLGVTYGTSNMGQEFTVNATRMESDSGSMESVQVAHMAIADNFLEVMGMTLSEGRNFSPLVATDSNNAILVNEALVDVMGWEQPIGKSVQATWGSRGTVVGVVQNFNFKSLHSEVEPFLMYQPGFSTASRLGPERLLVVQIAANQAESALEFVEDTVTSLDAGRPFEYEFLNSSLDELYLSERSLLYLISGFSLISIVITCLGLFGLAAFTTEQRSREIGIRKVLGASRWQIAGLLGNRILLLTVVGTIISTAVAYPVINRWLAVFAYRMEINPLVFLLAAGIVGLIAYGTIVMQTLRIATINPAATLRCQ